MIRQPVPSGTGEAVRATGAGVTAGERPTRPRTAWIVLGVGVLAYVLTVMQRTSFGVVGIDAAQRFEVSPGALVDVRLHPGCGLCVAADPGRPVGRSLGLAGDDRLERAAAGCRPALLAFSADISTAVPARILVGAGDALVFVAVLALIPRWFHAGRVPLLTQLTGIIGQLGQVLSAIPFVALLHSAGWSVAFSTAAAGSALVVVLVLAVVRNAPGKTWTPAPTMSVTRDRHPAQAGLDAARAPGLDFFGHMGTQFSMMVFVLLWGVPYLVSAQGLSTATAGALMTVFVVCTILIGPVIGMLTMRHPMRRSWLLLGIIAANVTVWTAVLSLSEPAPLWLLVVLVVVLVRRRPRFGRRLRHRPHLEPQHEPRGRPEHGQHRRLPGHAAGAGLDGDDPDGAGRLHRRGFPGRLAGAVPGLGIRGDRGADHPTEIPALGRRAWQWCPRPLREVFAGKGKAFFAI